MLTEEDKYLIEQLTKSANKVGFGTATVKDGHFVMLNTRLVKKYLEEHPNKENILLFCQTPTKN
jgi:hypothetical protein